MEWTHIKVLAEFCQADRAFKMLLDVAAYTLRDFHLGISLPDLARAAALAGAIARLFFLFWRSKEHDVLSFWPSRMTRCVAVDACRAHSDEKRAVGTAITLHHRLPVLLFDSVFYILHGSFLLFFQLLIAT